VLIVEIAMLIFSGSVNLAIQDCPASYQNSFVVKKTPGFGELESSLDMLPDIHFFILSLFS
jgi:hypothetical protein